MPTYEYACDSCGNGFEVFQKMADSPVKDCPQCGASVRRVLSGGIGISFRGSGFYVNDAASGSPSSTAAAPSSASSAKASAPKPGAAKPACASCPAKAAASGGNS